MHFSQLIGWHDVRYCGAQLVLPTGDHLALASHHGVEACFRNHARIVLVLLADFCVHHIGTLEEVRFGGARHQACNADTAVDKLMPKGEGETVKECLAAIVDGLGKCPA